MALAITVEYEHVCQKTGEVFVFNLQLHQYVCVADNSEKFIENQSLQKNFENVNSPVYVCTNMNSSFCLL